MTRTWEQLTVKDSKMTFVVVVEMAIHDSLVDVVTRRTAVKYKTEPFVENELELRAGSGLNIG